MLLNCVLKCFVGPVIIYLINSTKRSSGRRAAVFIETNRLPRASRRSLPNAGPLFALEKKRNALIAFRGSIPLYSLYKVVPPDRVWFLHLSVLNRIYMVLRESVWTCPKQSIIWVLFSIQWLHKSETKNHRVRTEIEYLSLKLNKILK